MTDADSAGGSDRSLLRRLLSFGLYAFAVIGLVLSIAIVAGLAVDVVSFDRTSGGYEPPYTDYTDEPID